MTQISPAVYLEYFEKWLSQGKDILSLCFSSGMSSTWQNAYICAEELKEKLSGTQDYLCGYFVRIYRRRIFSI